ncbi:MAG: hypothetical protein WCF65_08995 [Parachlamydiaceae bacterium]
MNIGHRIVRKIRSKLAPQQIPPPPLLLSAFNITSLSAPGEKPLFSHSGNAGDIIFSCALLKAFWKHTGKKVHLHLQTDIPVMYPEAHPLKNVLLNQRIAEQLEPALRMQTYIADVSIGPACPDQAVDLSSFRRLPFEHRIGLIQGWYQLCTDIWIDLFEPWMDASKLPEYKNTILVSRTNRLRSDYINYRFLAQYAENLVFIGLPEEYSSFNAETGFECHAMTVKSFDQLLNIIHSCRLFVGNQGLAYSIAESVKCPRVLESNSIAPNNYPLSPNGRIALFQEQFESFVRTLLV